MRDRSVAPLLIISQIGISSASPIQTWDLPFLLRRGCQRAQYVIIRMQQEHDRRHLAQGMKMMLANVGHQTRDSRAGPDSEAVTIRGYA
jgi:hypothetical protein